MEVEYQKLQIMKRMIQRHKFKAERELKIAICHNGLTDCYRVNLDTITILHQDYTSNGFYYSDKCI